jgi:hypothetical protein
MSLLNNDYTRVPQNALQLNGDFPTVEPRVGVSFGLAYTESTKQIVFDKGTIAANDYDYMRLRVSDGAKNIWITLNAGTPANITASLSTLNTEAEGWTIDGRATKKGKEAVYPTHTFSPKYDFDKTFEYPTA